MSEEYLFDRINETYNTPNNLVLFNLKINKNGNILLKSRQGWSCAGHPVNYGPYRTLFEINDYIRITLNDTIIIEDNWNMLRELKNPTYLINIIKIIKKNNIQINENYEKNINR